MMERLLQGDITRDVWLKYIHPVVIMLNCTVVRSISTGYSDINKLMI